MDARELLLAHLASHPEDASALGIAGHADRLPEPTPDAAAAEATRCREVLAKIGLPGVSSGPDLDRDAAARVFAFHARYAEKDRDASNLELAALPNAMLQHAAIHAAGDSDWEALARRAALVGPFLERHAANLRRGVGAGRACDREIARVFATRVLPSAADAIGTLAFRAGAMRTSPAVAMRVAAHARDASDAYRRFAKVLEDEIAPAAAEDVVLGEEETSFRLRDVMGIETSADELLAEARAQLERAQATLDTERVMAVMAARPASLDAALAGYRRWLGEATNFVRDRELVPIPTAMALELEPLPGGIADGGSVTNWPAPLFDPGGKGHILYATDPAAHATVAMKNLAVHEGVPGHYLQSVVWQRGATEGQALRYVGVADEVAFARGFFGATVAVEGWAVHMEQLLRAHGFYDSRDELLFFDLCDAIRAMRVIVDLELHRGRMDSESAARFVAQATRMPEGWARSQVVRSKRLPLQGVTYLVGQQEIAKSRRRFRGSDLLFHERLLALGPVPASRAAIALAV